MTSKRWAIIFFISLAVNIFLIAVVAAGLWKVKQVRSFSGAPLYSSGWVARVLGDDVKPQARAILRQNREAISQSRRRFRDLHNNVRDALAAEPFDRAALEAALTELRNHGQTAQRGMHRNMTILAEGLTADQRQRLGEVVEKMMEHRAERARRRAERRRKRNGE